MKKNLLFSVCILLVSCINHANDSPALSQAAKINTELGLDYLQQNNFIRAKEKLLLAKQQNPNSPEVLAAFGYFYQVTHHVTLADTFYRSALKKAPSNPSILNNYGVFLCQQHHYQLAIQYFLQAANLMDNVAPAKAFENAGLCALKIPDKIQADGYFKLAWLNQPHSTQIRTSHF